MRTLSLFGIAAVLGACATPGARPGDMSVAGHEAAAVRWTSAPGGAGAESSLKDAEAHRAAAQTLRGREALACQGLAASDRYVSPFAHLRDIERATPLYATVTGWKTGARAQLSGATVRFRAIPGLTGEWFQRIIDCHLAWNAAVGNVVPEMPDCRLVPKGARTLVRSAGAGFEVDISSDEKGSPDEIWARAQRLVSAR